MDVKYRPEPWQNMGDGMNRITKDALIKLQRANELLKKIDGRIRDLDSDGSIHFNPKDQSQKIGELLDSYSTLQRYCGEVGRLVSEHIDKPFLVEMDKFAQKMRDTSILSFETDNRIGSTTTTVLPDAHAGYGSVPQTIKTKKDKITVEDIFRDSPAFDNVLREEYKELKKQNPDAKLNYEEYKKVVPSTRGFEYKSIEDEQKKLEMVRDIGIGVGIIITTILCPPLGTAAAVVYGAVQIKSGIDGEDWGTHRKLSQEERVGNIIFGGLDAIPVVGAVGKGVKAFKGTSELADLAKLLKFKEGMPGFNPNLGKNVVQSLKENNLLKNLKIQGWKTVDKINDADYFIKGLVAKGVDETTAFIRGEEVLLDGSVRRYGGTNFSESVKEAHDASKASIQSRISNLESGGVKGTGDTSKAVDDVVKDGSHFLDEFKLKPNVKYETNGYLYQTDELGRIESASGELTLEMGERNSKHQLAAGGEDRVKAPSTQGDHGGHLIGTQFNGSPLIDNIVAMNGNVNVSAYKKLESAWAKALRGGKEVFVDIRPRYSGTSIRPDSFAISYKINGIEKVKILKNIYGG
ncbi:DNA/RNA non-specific endonuclease [Bacillus paranthracis]|uniref:Ribonuclease YeeF n=1 Tax=Bacillus paranthracis TaxID=2026186 RepID=A0A9X8SNC9_9BACI|nr:DNA/RNA non-specific endonuclease [Bacillus paranthracis]SME43221.1 Putative ribonuclease YeeF [Bacillus paranthracis]